MVGTTISHYKVLEKIGEGGMGVVYRAIDTKLNRDVALKILPQQFASDSQRMARFQREAEVLASLDHPNIGQIYGIEEAGQTKALVLQLIEGPTLAERIAQGPIPVEETLKIALQIAEGLEAAHENGVIHRDLKPANIKITPEGQVKILDFGLAKAMEAEVPDSSLSQSPTLTAAATQAGVILGTAAYMSPEQARGKSVDKRADIWAFGVVLYEMLVGKNTFEGEDISLMLAAVMKDDPSWESLPNRTPQSIRRLLRRCLTKDSNHRLRDIGDARLELTSAPEPPVEGKVQQPMRSRWAIPLVAALLLAIAGLVLSRPDPASPLEVRRFQVRTDPGTYIAPFAPSALSPDGRSLVYGLVDPVGGFNSQVLMILDLVGGFDAEELVSGELVKYPFFSPSGDAVGFNSSNDLRQVSPGGAPTLLVASVDTVGATWISSDEAVLARQWGYPLERARLGDSTRTSLTKLNVEDGEVTHLWPQVLPDGQNVLFTIWRAAPEWDDAAVAVANLESGEHRVVLERGTFGRYVSSGHLVFWRSGDLWAVPFDLDRLETTGEETRVVEGVRLEGGISQAHFSISETGTLAYISGGLDHFQETLIVDRSGSTLVPPERFGATGNPQFSPNGGRVALSMYRGGTFHIGVYDRERDLLRQLTTENDNYSSTWTPDGTQLTYLSTASGPYRFHSRSADGSGTPEIVIEGEPDECCMAAKWSPDRGDILFNKPGAVDQDIWVASPGSDRPATVLVADPGDQDLPDWSPDGRYFVYRSNQGGEEEIYIRPFPEADSRSEQVSISGGRAPVWSRDGAAIYYASDQGIMSVSFTEGAAPNAFTLGTPTLVLEMTGVRVFDVSPDGEMFVITRNPIETFATEINIVQNWFEELKERVPVP